MRKFLSLLIFLTFATTFSALGQGLKASKIELKYGLFLKKVVPNFKEGTFYAEFYWWTTFVNDSTKTGYKNEDIMNLQYVNGSEVESDAFSNEIEETKYLGNNQYYYSGYHQGNFFFQPEFNNYPFDKQQVKIEIEHTLLLDEQVSIQPDIQSYNYSGMSPNFYGISSDLLEKSSVSMKIYKSEIKEGSCLYNTNFGDPTFPPTAKYSRLTYSVFLERNVIPYITKFFIPLAIILLLVYFVFFTPAENLDLSAGLTVTSLLSAIAFQFTINSDLPEIGYMIYVDKVFYLTYILIVLAMGESLLTYYYDLSPDEKKKKLAIKLDVYSRFLFPIVFLSLCYLFKR